MPIIDKKINQSHKKGAYFEFSKRNFASEDKQKKYNEVEKLKRKTKINLPFSLL